MWDFDRFIRKKKGHLLNKRHLWLNIGVPCHWEIICLDGQGFFKDIFLFGKDAPYSINRIVNVKEQRYMRHNKKQHPTKRQEKKMKSEKQKTRKMRRTSTQSNKLNNNNNNNNQMRMNYGNKNRRKKHNSTRSSRVRER